MLDAQPEFDMWRAFLDQHPFPHLDWAVLWDFILDWGKFTDNPASDPEAWRDHVAHSRSCSRPTLLSDGLTLCVLRAAVEIAVKPEVSKDETSWTKLCSTNGLYLVYNWHSVNLCWNNKGRILTHHLLPEHTLEPCDLGSKWQIKGTFWELISYPARFVEGHSELLVSLPGHWPLLSPLCQSPFLSWLLGTDALQGFILRSFPPQSLGNLFCPLCITWVRISVSALIFSTFSGRALELRSHSCKWPRQDLNPHLSESRLHASYPKKLGFYHPGTEELVRTLHSNDNLWFSGYYYFGTMNFLKSYKNMDILYRVNLWMF